MKKKKSMTDRFIFNKYQFVLYKYQDASLSDTDNKLCNFPEQVHFLTHAV